MTSLSEILWIKAEQVLRTTKTAVIPLGSVEQHGPHLPLGTDWIIAQELAKRVSERTGAVMLPVMPFGYAEYHMDFPGTVTLSQDSLYGVMSDVCRSIAKWGVRRILFVNGHGGNLATLRSVCLKLRAENGVLSAVAQWFDIFDEVEGWKATEHGGMIETCLMMGIDPGLVDLERAITPLPQPLSNKIQMISISRAKFSDGRVHIFLRTRDVTESGSMTETEESTPITDFSFATAEKGREILRRFVEYLVGFCCEFEKTSLPSPR